MLYRLHCSTRLNKNTAYRIDTWKTQNLSHIFAGYIHSLDCIPPDTTSVSPVTYDASSEHRNATALATSSGWANLQYNICMITQKQIKLIYFWKNHSSYINIILKKKTWIFRLLKEILCTYYVTQKKKPQTQLQWKGTSQRTHTANYWWSFYRITCHSSYNLKMVGKRIPHSSNIGVMRWANMQVQDDNWSEPLGRQDW